MTSERLEQLRNGCNCGCVDIDELIAEIDRLKALYEPDDLPDRPTRNVRGTQVPVGAHATLVRGVSPVNGEVIDRVVWFDFADTTGPVNVYIERQIGRPL